MLNARNVQNALVQTNSHPTSYSETPACSMCQGKAARAQPILCQLHGLPSTHPLHQDSSLTKRPPSLGPVGSHQGSEPNALCSPASLSAGRG